MTKRMTEQEAKRALVECARELRDLPPDRRFKAALEAAALKREEAERQLEAELEAVLTDTQDRVHVALQAAAQRRDIIEAELEGKC